MNAVLKDGTEISTLRSFDRKQVVKTGVRDESLHDGPVDIVVEIRFDDRCRNGHNDFSVTGTVYKAGRRGDYAVLTCGCIHEVIAKHFPELAHALPYHLMSANGPEREGGPMHYIANTLYHASRRDCHGYRMGEVSSVEKRLRVYEAGGTCPFPLTLPLEEGLGRNLLRLVEAFKTSEAVVGTENVDVSPVEVPHVNTNGETYKFKPKYTLACYPVTKWHDCPFDTQNEAVEWAHMLISRKTEVAEFPKSYSEGKRPEFDHARSAAVWPEATDEDLDFDYFSDRKEADAAREQLKARLEARLPKLMMDFRFVVEGLGFKWTLKEGESNSGLES